MVQVFTDASAARASLGAALLFAFAVAACGDRGIGSSSHSAEPIAPEAPGTLDEQPLPDRDVYPPRFDGVERVELLGQGVYRLAWAPADDDVSPPEAIAYQVLHIVEPWRAPTPNDAPLTSSLPGNDTVDVAVDGPTGRFFVRAIDQAGNASPWGEGLVQRSTRPWVRVPGGDPIARIDDCAPLEPGRVLCVGEDGFAARWDRDRWSRLNAVDGVQLRLHPGPSDLWVWSEWGHLYRAPLTDSLEPAAMAFDGGEPNTPMRQFAADHVGLHWWIDADGVVWIGGGGRFLPMSSPLALPDSTACPGLTGIAFGEVAAFATCTGGAVYSVGLDEPGLRWLSLTTTTTFEVDTGLRRVVADGDGGARFVFRDAIRSVGVGGWTTELTVGETIPGAPAESDRVGLIRDIVRTDFALWAATDIGLIERSDDAWRFVTGTAGDIAGVVPPTPIEPRGVYTLIHTDGSVARVQRRRVQWLVEPPASGFFAARTVDGGIVALRRGTERGVWRHDGETWTRVTAELPDPLTDSGEPTAFGVSPNGEHVVIATVDEAGQPALWTLTDGRFREGQWLASEPLPAEDSAVGAPADDEPALGPDGDPLPPPPPPALDGVPFDRLPDENPPPTLEPIRGIDVQDDGRMVAVGTQTVWWRIDAGWLHLETLDVELVDVGLDAGEAWVARTESDIRRCWRSQCDAEVENADWPAGEMTASWHAADGWRVMDVDGAVHRFVPGTIDPDLEGLPRLDQTPRGDWVEAAPAPADLPGGTIVRRLREGAADVFWTDDGGLHTLVDGAWTRQATEPDAYALVAADGGWALLTDMGLVTAGEVPSVIRSPRATP